MRLRYNKLMLLRRPSVDQLRRFVEGQAQLGFTYSEVGATARNPPLGFIVDHTRAYLGRGEVVFNAAKTALERWQQFNLGWLEAWPARTPIVVGSVIAVLAFVHGTWWLNACRIVYTIDDEGLVRRFGFAYGTLPGHAEMGEERFLVEWDRSSDAVHFDILAFSRPRHPLARIGYPLVRRLQKKFAREAATAMQREVAELTR